MSKADNVLKNKTIFIITQYFPPEIGGGARRSSGFAGELSKLGCKVKVIAPFPSYLIRESENGKKFHLYRETTIDGITVFRTYAFVSNRENNLKLILYYITFTISSIIVGLWKIKKADYLIVISPPLFTGISGVILKKIKKLELIFDIGDLWPESAIQLGRLKSKLAIKLSFWLERRIYANSYLINLVTRLTLKSVQEQHASFKNINYIPNFVDTEVFRKTDKDSELIRKLQLENKMVCGYAGNIGAAQGLKIILEAANITRSNPDIIYLIIGDGIEKNRISDAIKAKSLNNIILLAAVRNEEVIKYISLFDVMIIPLVKNDLFKMTIPSKLYESMAAEIPVLLCVDGEAREILEKANCGFYVEPENSKMLAEKISYLYNNKHLLPQLGKNGKSLAEKEFSRKKVIKSFYDVLISNENKNKEK